MNEEDLNILITDCTKRLEDILAELSNVSDEHGVCVRQFDHEPISSEFIKVTDIVRKSHACSGYTLNPPKEERQ